MRQAELIRYLVLAAQREGNRRLTGELRAIGLTPSQSEVMRILGDHAPLSLDLDEPGKPFDPDWEGALARINARTKR